VVRVRFEVSVRVYWDYRSCNVHWHCMVEGRHDAQALGSIKWESSPWEPPLDVVTYIVNKYAKQIQVLPDAYGFEVDLPESAVLALEYSVYATNPSFHELDEIVASGRTKIHDFFEALGLQTGGKRLRDLFLKHITAGDFGLNPQQFPRVTLYAEGGSVRVEFNAEAVDRKFLKRALHGELEEAEVKMLRGITVLGKNAQARHMQLLSEGKLSVDEVAKAVFKSAVQAKNKDVWLAAADWLKANGYGKQASEVVARKTICS
jgi:hypothetical protein